MIKTPTKKEIIKIYKNKKHTGDVAKYFGVSRSTLQRWLKLYSISLKIKNTINSHFFSEYNEYSCYWAGFIAADGYFRNYDRIKTVVIHLKYSDKNHLRLFKRLLNSSTNIKQINKLDKRTNKTYYGIYFNLYDVLIYQDLREKFSITTKNKSKELKPPILIPENMIKHYIRGLIDGDGCFCKLKNGDYRFSLVGSNYIAEWVRDIFVSRIGLNKVKIYTKKKNCYVLPYGGKNNVRKIRDYLYSDATIYLMRKKDVVRGL